MNTTAIHRLITSVALILLVLLCARAVLTVDPYFDSFAYHLPFAARLAGICPESCFRMGNYLESAYDGFPKLINFLQGWVWRISGRARAIDLVNIGALLLFCALLRAWFLVPLAWSFCALLAVPLIHIQVTSSYIDVPVNLAAAAAILGLMLFVRAPESFGWRKFMVLGACLAFAANGKPQMIGVSVPLLTLFAAIAFIMLAAGRHVGPFVPRRPSAWLGLICVLFVMGALVGAKSIDNWIGHGNPFYPIRIDLLGLEFEGPIEGVSIGADSLAEVWHRVPSPLRWLASVFEFGAYEYRQTPWTYDQGYCQTMLEWKECARSITSSFRMGGYFVPYVLSLLAFFAWWLASQAGRYRRLLLITFIGTTLFAAFLPRSHELRYYLFWMIVLIALCLIMVFDPQHSRMRMGSRFTSGLLGGIVLIALLSVVLMTQGRYITPSGPDIKAVIDIRGIEPRTAAIPDGAVACIDPGWQPFSFLFASIFHPGRSYSALDGAIGDCDIIIPRPPDP